MPWRTCMRKGTAHLQALSLVSLVAKVGRDAREAGSSARDVDFFQRSMQQAVSRMADAVAAQTSQQPHEGSSSASALGYPPPLAFVPSKPAAAGTRAPEAHVSSMHPAAASVPHAHHASLLPHPQIRPAKTQADTTAHILQLDHFPAWKSVHAAAQLEHPRNGSVGNLPERSGASGAPAAAKGLWRKARANLNTNTKQVATSASAAKGAEAEAKPLADTASGVCKGPGSAGSSPHVSTHASVDDVDVEVDEDVDALLAGGDGGAGGVEVGYGRRTTLVAGWEASDTLRRLDDLLECARSELGTLAAAETVAEKGMAEKGAVEKGVDDSLGAPAGDATSPALADEAREEAHAVPAAPQPAEAAADPRGQEELPVEAQAPGRSGQPQPL